MRNINDILDNQSANERQTYVGDDSAVYYADDNSPMMSSAGTPVFAITDEQKQQYNTYRPTQKQQNTVQIPVQDSHPLSPYSQKVTESRTQNQYDYDAANERYKQALGEYGQMYEPIKRSQDDYINGLNAIYERYNPDKTEPAKQDMRLAGIQALATALSDLGKAAGKTLGNNDGLGMVTVDKSQKFDNMFEYLRKAQQNYRNAENEKATKELQQQLEIFKEKYKNDKDFQKAMRDYALKERNKALENTKTTQTVKNVWENPNSKEYQERQAKIQREIDKEKRQDAYQKEKLSIEREKLKYQKNKDLKESKNKKTYSISNITFENPKYFSKKGQKAYNDGDYYYRALADVFDEFEFDNEKQLNSFYKRFYPTIKEIDTDAKIETKPDEQIKQIENTIYKIHQEDNPDSKERYYKGYVKSKKDSGLDNKYWHQAQELYK